MLAVLLPGEFLWLSSSQLIFSHYLSRGELERIENHRIFNVHKALERGQAVTIRIHVSCRLSKNLEMSPSSEFANSAQNRNTNEQRRDECDKYKNNDPGNGK